MLITHHDCLILATFELCTSSDQRAVFSSLVELGSETVLEFGT